MLIIAIAVVRECRRPVDDVIGVLVVEATALHDQLSCLAETRSHAHLVELLNCRCCGLRSNEPVIKE